MRIEELRIGNLVLYKDKIEEINNIIGDYDGVNMHMDYLDYIYISDLQPIQLTEEILLKFGFEKIIRKGCERYIHDDLFEEVEKQGNDFAFCIWNEENPATTNFIMHCNWLHTFQNNFFALTNQELNIEL